MPRKTRTQSTDPREESAFPTLYLFAGSNGAGKTTFAKAYLRQLNPIPRFLNADEIARGLSPLAPRTLAVKAGKLLLHEVQGCLKSGDSFGLESTLSGTTHIRIFQQAKSLGYHIELHYLWLPSPDLAIRRIAQRVKMGGHDIPESDVLRRFHRSRKNFTALYAPLADLWMVWDNRPEPPLLLFTSETANLSSLTELQ
jgi:predicted ABC-type ATPase